MVRFTRKGTCALPPSCIRILRFGASVFETTEM